MAVCETIDLGRCEKMNKKGDTKKKKGLLYFRRVGKVMTFMYMHGFYTHAISMVTKI